MNRTIFTVAAALGALAVQSSAAQPGAPAPWFPTLAVMAVTDDARLAMLTQAQATSDACLAAAAGSLGDLRNPRAMTAVFHEAQVREQYERYPCFPMATPVTSPADLSAITRAMPPACAAVYQAHAAAIDEAAAINVATAQVFSTQQTCTTARQAQRTSNCDDLRRQYEMFDPAQDGALFAKVVQALRTTGLDPTVKFQADTKSAMQALGCPNIP